MWVVNGGLDLFGFMSLFSLRVVYGSLCLACFKWVFVDLIDLLVGTNLLIVL